MPNKGDNVSARVFHAAVGLNDRIVIFGGIFEYPIDEYNDDFFEYSVKESKWCKVVTTGYRPLGRVGAAAGRYGKNSVVYFGGYNENYNVHFDDAFVYNSETRQVTLVKPYGSVPTPRKRMGHCSVGTEFIICGGVSPNKDEKANRKYVFNNDEMYVLSLLPTLQQPCMIVVKETGLDTCNLPKHIREWLNEF